MNALLKESLGLTLQAVTEVLGDLPSSLDSEVRGVLESNSTSVLARCAVCLERCLHDGDYVALEMFVQENRT